ncbi:LOB domain-containing protein 18-like isoform X2 [Musa acuminata AAA Group]|uniref:LOB domain-containing protein 18-like isoform X2 n=1 Tax=Musa acuminata AAA Group TaxID=214697 RepID=UPI0031DC60FA
MASSSSSSNSPCAACKFLRRKCMPGCIFAPYFPPEEPQKFANVHKVFGASNVTKLLNELLPHQREDAVNSLAYEAEARVKDPVYGCVGAISVLQRQVQRLQKELDAANAELLRYACNEIPMGLTVPPTMASPMMDYPRIEYCRRTGINGGSPLCPAPALALPSLPPWSGNDFPGDHENSNPVAMQITACELQNDHKATNLSSLRELATYVNAAVIFFRILLGGWNGFGFRAREVGSETEDRSHMLNHTVFPISAYEGRQR